MYLMKNVTAGITNGSSAGSQDRSQEMETAENRWRKKYDYEYTVAWRDAYCEEDLLECKRDNPGQSTRCRHVSIHDTALAARS